MKHPLIVKVLVGLMIAATLYRIWVGWDFNNPAETGHYSLIDDEIPDDVRARLHPWIAGFIGLSPEQAKARLEERWETIDRPSLRALSNVLLESKITYLVDSPEGGMICATRPDTYKSGNDDFWYLPAPPERSVIQEQLEPIGLADNKALGDFLYHFGDLAESHETSGYFMHSESPFPTFTDSWDGAIKDFDEWEGSLMLFHALNGCFILVRQDGSVGWWMMQEHRVKKEANDFDEFILEYSEYRKISWPCDPYGPPDDER